MGSGVSSPRWPPGHQAGSCDVKSGIGCAVLRVCVTRLGAACGAHAVWRGKMVGSELYRVIRTARLSALPRLHLRPIDVVVFHDP